MNGTEAKPASSTLSTFARTSPSFAPTIQIIPRYLSGCIPDGTLIWLVALMMNNSKPMLNPCASNRGKHA